MNDYGLNKDWLETGNKNKLSIFGGDNRALRLYDKLDKTYQRIDERAQEHGTTVKREAAYFGTAYLSTQAIIFGSVYNSTGSVTAAYSSMVVGSKILLPAYPIARALFGKISKSLKPEPATKHLPAPDESPNLRPVPLDEHLQQTGTDD